MKNENVHMQALYLKLDVVLVQILHYNCSETDYRHLAGSGLYPQTPLAPALFFAPPPWGHSFVVERERRALPKLLLGGLVIYITLVCSYIYTLYTYTGRADGSFSLSHVDRSYTELCV